VNCAAAALVTVFVVVGEEEEEEEEQGRRTPLNGKLKIYRRGCPWSRESNDELVVVNVGTAVWSVVLLVGVVGDGILQDTRISSRCAVCKVVAPE
jgi:hypothetical protein